MTAPLDYAYEEDNDKQAPPANKGLAVAITIVLVALPILFFGWVLG